MDRLRARTTATEESLTSVFGCFEPNPDTSYHGLKCHGVWLPGLSLLSNSWILIFFWLFRSLIGNVLLMSILADTIYSNALQTYSFCVFGKCTKVHINTMRNRSEMNHGKNTRADWRPTYILHFLWRFLLVGRRDKDFISCLQGAYRPSSDQDCSVQRRGGFRLLPVSHPKVVCE